MPNRIVLAFTVLFSALAASCGSDNDPDEGNNGPNSSNNNNGGSSEPDDFIPDELGTLEEPIFPEGEDIVGNSGDGAGGGDVSGAECDTLEHTQVRYCTKASAECMTEGANCPLYVLHNTDSSFKWFDDPDAEPMVVTKGNGVSDGNEVKHWVSEIALTVMRDYPGIDSKKVFFLGWSHGAGAAYRGICHKAKGYGISAFGNNGEIYAGMVTMGGCPSCTDPWTPTGKFHTLAINGAKDQFASDGCEESLHRMAADNGCSNQSPKWQKVEAGDAYMEGGKGTDAAIKLDFGDCPNGEVLGYRFKGEGHNLSFGKNFDPKVQALDIAFEFLQGKSK